MGFNRHKDYRVNCLLSLGKQLAALFLNDC
jgi:hypothetical protein